MIVCLPACLPCLLDCTGVSLMFSAEGQLVFKGGQNYLN